MSDVVTTYGVCDAAKMLGLAPNTLKSRIKQGMPVIQVGEKGKPWQVSVPDAVIYRSGLDNAAPRIAQKVRSATTNSEANSVVQSEINTILLATRDALNVAVRTRSVSEVDSEDE